ncbi:MAG: hypothetical protein V3U06_02535, partial [Candidatus Binatia bacterium]
MLEPEVCDVDARVKPHPIVLKGVFDELIQQIAHPSSPADVHVAGVAKLHGVPVRLLVTDVEGFLQLPETSIQTERHEIVVSVIRHDIAHRRDLFPIHVDDVRDIRVGIISSP